MSVPYRGIRVDDVDTLKRRLLDLRRSGLCEVPPLGMAGKEIAQLVANSALCRGERANP